MQRFPLMAAAECCLPPMQVVIDAFRLINPQTMMLGQEPRQVTSNLGHLEKASIQVHLSTNEQFCSLFDDKLLVAMELGSLAKRMKSS